MKTIKTNKEKKKSKYLLLFLPTKSRLSGTRERKCNGTKTVIEIWVDPNSGTRTRPRNRDENEVGTTIKMKTEPR